MSFELFTNVLIYLKDEIDTLLGGKSDTTHTHTHAGTTGQTADDHHAQAHTLGSHSTKAHSELSDIGADDHHAKAHDHSSAAQGGNLGALAANLNLNSHKATGMSSGTAAGDGANLGQVKAVIAGCMYGSGSGLVAAGTTTYINIPAGTFNNVSASAVEMMLPYACVIRNLRIRTVSSQPATGDLVFTSFVNESAANLIVTIAANSGASLYGDITHSDSVGAGGRFGLRVVNNAATASAQIAGICVEVDLI